MPQILFYSTQQNRPIGKTTKKHLTISINNTMELIARLFQGYDYNTSDDI